MQIEGDVRTIDTGYKAKAKAKATPVSESRHTQRPPLTHGPFRPEKSLTRRELLRKSGSRAAHVADLTARTTLAASILGGLGSTEYTAHEFGVDTHALDATKSVVDTAIDISGLRKEKEIDSTLQLFENKDTEKIDRKLGLSITDFIAPGELRMDHADYLKGTDLLPIFHPAICHPDKNIGIHKDLIIKAALKHDINPNIAAFIASFQSGGDAGKPGGLFGISSDKFNEFSDSNTSLDDIHNPVINADIAMRIFKDSLTTVLKKVDTNLLNLQSEGIHPEVLALAIHDMTEGDQAQLPFDQQTEISHNNLFTIRSFFNTWNLASNMRQGELVKNVKKMDDHEIRADLRSREIDARMYAIGNYLGNIGLDDLIRYFSEDEIPDPATFILKNNYDDISFNSEEELLSALSLYDAVIAGGKSLTYPLNPWLRRHHATTSISDITHYAPNANLNAWSD